VATIETSTEHGGSAGDSVRIAISDTGIGMDEATMARIFEPFFTTKEQGRGTGLGLATAYGFIKQSGGSITVSSKPGAGSVFTILLPFCSAEGAAKQKAEGSASSVGGNENILVVDDEPALRSLVRQTLAGYGYRVWEAEGGEDALRIMSESPAPFDLLVTDVIMPDMTGPQLARRLTGRQPSLRVLFISGYPGETEAERAEFGPGAAYLGKPFTADALLKAVRRELSREHGGAAQAG
jgi:CheY-like chemotaxis protein